MLATTISSETFMSMPSQAMRMKKNRSNSGEELTEDDLAFCLHHMNFTEEAVRNWFRNFRAECPDGRLSKEHLNGLFNRIFPEGESEVFCDHIFRIFDDDNNGFLDFKVILYFFKNFHV